MERDSPASTRLPYDILRQITVYAYEYIPRALEPDGTELDLQLVSPPIPASHVCRSWRYALLSDPSVWSVLIIPRIRPSGVLELLRRSGSALLNVIFVMRSHIKADYDDNTISSLLSQIYRFKLLQVEINSSHVLELSDPLHKSIQQVLAGLRRPAPQLETFRFWYNNFGLPLEDTFLNTLFSKEAPNLKHLRHELSYDFRELNCPLFRDLSELQLSLPYSLTLDFGRFLDLLALSPCLKLFRLYTAWEWFVRSSVDSSTSGRKVNLPCLKRLDLEVNTSVDLLILILEHIVPSPDFNWYFDFQYQPNLTDSLSQTLYQAHFTSLHITFTDADFIYVSFQENTHHQFYNNKLVYSHENATELLFLWDGLMQSVSTSSITHLDIEVDGPLEQTALSTILSSLRDLISLSIKQLFSTDVDVVESCVLCLLGLTLVQSEAEASDSHASHTWNFELDFLPRSSEELLCPRLIELTMELSKSQFTKKHASLIRTCYDLRRKTDRILEISVRCHTIEDGVESVLQSNNSSVIFVSTL